VPNGYKRVQLNHVNPTGPDPIRIIETNHNMQLYCLFHNLHDVLWTSTDNRRYRFRHLRKQFYRSTVRAGDLHPDIPLHIKNAKETRGVAHVLYSHTHGWDTGLCSETRGL